MWKAAFFVLLFSLYSGLIHYLAENKYILKESQESFMVGGILVIGYFFLKVLQSRLMKTLEGHLDHDRIITLRYFFDVGYFLLWGILLITFLGPGFKNLVLGGAILSALAGIVAQSSLTNLFAGVVLALTHPFRVGERISFLTWQYPRLPSTAPHSLVSPEHRGTVLEIGKIYTRIMNEDGREMLIPNNIMLQAMVLRKMDTAEQPVRLLIDLPSSSNLDFLKDKLESLARDDQRFAAPIEFVLQSFSPTTITVEVRSRWKGESIMDCHEVLFSTIQPITLSKTPDLPSNL